MSSAGQPPVPVGWARAVPVGQHTEAEGGLLRRVHPHKTAPNGVIVPQSSPVPEPVTPRPWSFSVGLPRGGFDVG